MQRLTTHQHPLREAGIRVPDDVSVLGFDDIHTAELGTPSLTTVTQDARRWAEAATALLAQLTGRHARNGWIGDSELIVRGSTGPAPQARS